MQYAKALGYECENWQQCQQRMFESASTDLVSRIKAQVNLNPNALERQAQARTIHTNTQRAVSEESLIENAFESAVQQLCNRFSEVSEYLESPLRVYWNKHIGLNASVASSVNNNVLFSQLVPYIELIQKSKNQKPAYKDGARQAVDGWVRAGLIQSRDSAALTSALAGLGEVLVNFKNSGRINMSGKRLGQLFEYHVKMGLPLSAQMHSLIDQYVPKVSNAQSSVSFGKLIEQQAVQLGFKLPKQVAKKVSPYDKQLWVIIKSAMELRKVVQKHVDTLATGMDTVFKNKTSYYNHVFGLLQGLQMTQSYQGGNALMDPKLPMVLDAMLERWTQHGDVFADTVCSKSDVIRRCSLLFAEQKEALREENGSFGRDSKVETQAYQNTLEQLMQEDPKGLLYLAYHYPQAKNTSSGVQLYEPIDYGGAKRKVRFGA